MIPFHTKDTPRGSLNSDVDDRGAGGGAGGVGATDRAELGAHGYEVEPRDFVDESGYAIESFSNVRQPLFYLCAALMLDLQTPSHIPVYEGSDSNKRFIVKKVRNKSNDLEIFKLLNTFWPKSECIISLHDSF